MEERKVNIKPGNVKPTRSVRARSSSSFDNSVNTNIRKYTFINILFHRKIYKIVFIYVSLILKRDYLQFICHKHTNSRRILLQCNCNRKWFDRIYILMKRLMKDSRKKFPCKVTPSKHCITTKIYISLTRISDIRKTNNIHKCIRQLLRIGCELRILGVEISTIKKYQFSTVTNYYSQPNYQTRNNLQ